MGGGNSTYAGPRSTWYVRSLLFPSASPQGTKTQRALIPTIDDIVLRIWVVERKVPVYSA